MIPRVGVSNHQFFGAKVRSWTPICRDLIRSRLIQGVTSFDDLSEEISALLSR